MKNSKFFNLNWVDLGKGLLIAFLTALLGGILELLQAGTLPTTWVAFQPIFELSLAAAVSYLLKNLFTNSEGTQRWMIMSGCRPDQVSMDAQFNGRYNGAFTYFDLLTYFRGIMLSENRIKVGLHLSKNGFIQVPELSGPYEYETFMSNK